MIAKNTATLSFFVAMTLAASCASFADPGIARSPISIRQTYADGKYSELSCHKFDCVLSYGVNLNGTKKGRVDFRLKGRLPNFVSGNYRFFETGTGVSVSVDVICNEHDRVKIQATEDQEVSCRQAFGFSASGLSFDGMTISDSTGARDDITILEGEIN